MTPWMKPTSIHRATSSACRAMTRIEQGAIGVDLVACIGIVPRDHMVGEQTQRFAVAAGSEELEGADADMAFGNARQHRAGQHGLAHHRLAGGDRRERSRRRNAQRRHRLADDVFAQHRSQRGAAVTAARERRGARALELDVAPHARAIDHLAQKDGAAVAELGHEVAELVAGIGERDRLRAHRQAVAGQDLDGLRALPACRGRGRARAASASLILIRRGAETGVGSSRA